MNGCAIITGASRGIGRAVALRLAADGIPVVINCVERLDAAEAVAREIISAGGSALCWRCDISDPRQTEEMAEYAEAHLGHIDILVNNAGISQQKLFTDITDADWERMMAVHVTGTFNCCRAVLPGMISRKYGRIINISSVWGISGGSCEVHYSAAKAAVIGLTKALAKEVAQSGVTVNCVAPGAIDTEMNSHLNQNELRELAEEIPAGRLGTPDEVAEAAAFFARPGASYITGQILSPNGGWLA